MDIVVISIASVVNAIAYRMGGSGRYNTKARDFGCSLVTNVAIASLVGWNWLAFVLSFGLLVIELKMAQKLLSPLNKQFYLRSVVLIFTIQ